MSNKTQLQTNNTKLDTLTSLAGTMQSKVANLPEAGFIPSGTLSITENGTHDVMNYASAEVNVAGGTGEDITSETNTYTTELAELTTAVTALENELAGKAAGGDSIELQEKTISPSTSSQSVVADDGYDGLSKVNVNAMPTATQATPSVTVSSNGLITASTTQSAGYVSAGTKSATKQMTTQAAKTVTPTTSEQTAVASGVYTTGVVKVGAIPSSYIQPSGTLSITENGTHDVMNYASAEVNVAGGGGDVGVDISGVTADADCVLEGYKFIDSDGNLKDGKMTKYISAVGDSNPNGFGWSIETERNGYTGEESLVLIHEGGYYPDYSHPISTASITINPSTQQQIYNAVDLDKPIGKVVVNPIEGWHKVGDLPISYAAPPPGGGGQMTSTYYLEVPQNTNIVLFSVLTNNNPYGTPFYAYWRQTSLVSSTMTFGVSSNSLFTINDVSTEDTKILELESVYYEDAMIVHYYFLPENN